MKYCIRSVVLLMVAVLLFCAPFTAGAAPKLSLKLGHAVPEENAYHYGALKFKELVEAKTGGEVQIDVFPNNQLGTGERDLLEGLQLGTVDVYVGSTGPMGGFEKRFLLFDFPFLFKDKKHVYSVLDGEIGQHILSLLGGKGMHGLAWMENGFRNLTNAKRSIGGVPDVKGLKIRTMENKVHMAMWRTLGVDPTPMAWSEVFTALQQGTIDGQENPIPVIYTSKLYEVQKHLALTRHVFSPAMIVVAKTVFDSLSQEHKKIFEDAAQEAALYQRQVCDKMENEFVDSLKQNGMEVTTPDLAPFQEACKSVYEEFRGELGEDAGLLDQIIAIGKE
ncbi:MAG: TRAP transporter substrate-binding protein [Synergistaceae bacterium]|jgi:tripartite ATP-independent transporter DctP family solute receptor|nr:TRAP transporter substrate-binding protein [Synergistaceae bacterium]